MVGLRRPVHSSIIPISWVSMIKIHSEEDSDSSDSFMDEVSEGPFTEAGEDLVIEPRPTPEES